MCTEMSFIKCMRHCKHETLDESSLSPERVQPVDLHCRDLHDRTTPCLAELLHLMFHVDSRADLHEVSTLSVPTSVASQSCASASPMSLYPATVFSLICGQTVGCLAGLVWVPGYPGVVNVTRIRPICKSLATYIHTVQATCNRC
jgi:hypothetical protein